MYSNASSLLKIYLGNVLAAGALPESRGELTALRRPIIDDFGEDGGEMGRDEIPGDVLEDLKK